MRFSSQLCCGKIFHRRFHPRNHSFTYPSKIPLVDLDALDELEKLPLVSVNRFGLYSFYEQDYLRDEKVTGETLKTRVLNLLKQHLEVEGNRNEANKLVLSNTRVFLLAHLRFLGKVFNPITVYYVFVDGECRYHISEVSNTPWNERHIYIHQLIGDKATERWECDKQFHVSPFNDMKQKYHWSHTFNDRQLELHLLLTDDEKVVFNACFQYDLAPLTKKTWCRSLWLRPLSSLHVVWGIYWQALKLFLKRIPIYDHPQSTVIEEKPSGRD